MASGFKPYGGRYCHFHGRHQWHQWHCQKTQATDCGPGKATDPKRLLMEGIEYT